MISSEILSERHILPVSIVIEKKKIKKEKKCDMHENEMCQTMKGSLTYFRLLNLITLNFTKINSNLLIDLIF